MSELLIDSDVFVDHLRGARGFDLEANRTAYSVITRAELFSGQFVDEARLRQFLGPFREIGVDRVIAERAGKLRRASSLLTPDALVAATAIEHDLILVTRNAKDYTAVKGLKLRAPA